MLNRHGLLLLLLLLIITKTLITLICVLTSLTDHNLTAPLPSLAMICAPLRIHEKDMTG